MAKELKEVVFSLDDQSEGKRLTLENVDLPTLRGFLEEVETLIKGDVKGATLAESQVKLETGSVVIKTFVYLALALNLESDLGKLNDNSDLDNVQPKRAEIIKKWQAKSRRNPACSYSVTGPGSRLSLRVLNTTHYERSSENSWVATKKYLAGKLVKAGGEQNPVLHFLLPDGQKLRIDAKQEQIRELKENPIYVDFTVYVEAEQNLVTKGLRNIKLVRYVKPGNAVDQRTMEELWRKGKQAWAGIQSASRWVEELRGNQ